MELREHHHRARPIGAVAGAAAVWLFAVAMPVASAQAQNLTYGEIKLGVLAHDVHFLGGKEGGADINPEIDLPSPVSNAWVESLPAYLSWALQPRPMVGIEVNTAGDTDQFYFGANWAWQVASDVLRPGDGIVIGYSFGPGFNDGKIHTTDPDRKSLGGHILFREALDIGYRITPLYQVSAYVDHISNGGLDRYNQSINDVGLRLGISF